MINVCIYIQIILVLTINYNDNKIILTQNEPNYGHNLQTINLYYNKK